jgi:hypothetical protein
MKRLLILTFIAVLAFPVFGDDKPNLSTEKNVLKINTLSLAVGTGSLFYERKISELTSVQLGLAYMNFTLIETKFTGLILTPEFRVYLKKGAIDGVYAAPYLRYQKFTMDNQDTNSEGKLSSMGGGVSMGRQWITDSGFTMDLFFGGHYGKSVIQVDSESLSDSFDSDFFEGFKMRMGFAIGFAF